MQPRYGRLMLAAAVAVSVWIVWPRSPVIGVAPGPADRTTGFAPDLQYVGVASCASMACHNRNGPKGSKGSEYTTWQAYDAHAQAYAVLYDYRSKIIEKNFRQLKDVAGARPEKDLLCLKCHALEVAPENHDLLIDGVSCENCHGPAQKWLTTHYVADWKFKSDADKAALGFRPTKDLFARAQACVECHVGAPDREVNHDLIAAGHPRLNFEYSAYLANIPKHWSEPKEHERYPDLEGRAWAMGQVASAKAALALLESRAGNEKLPWPEFSEYDCFACHHGLNDPSWRQARGYDTKVPGSFPWNTWYLSLLPKALAMQASGSDAIVVARLGDLANEMRKPYPDRKQVGQQAHEVAQQLGQWLGRSREARYDNPVALRNLLAGFAKDEKAAATSWDQAAQHYLAIAAMYQALGDVQPAARNPQLRASIRALVKPLEFPPGIDSPQKFDAKMFEEKLKAVQHQLEP
jgi:hypothetical protein